jgi:hypothetical protein
MDVYNKISRNKTNTTMSTTTLDIKSLSVTNLNRYHKWELVQIFLALPEKGSVSSKKPASKSPYFGGEDSKSERVTWRKSGDKLYAKRYTGKVLEEEMEWDIGVGQWFAVAIPNNRWDNKITFYHGPVPPGIPARVFPVNPSWMGNNSYGMEAYNKMCQRLSAEGIPADFHNEIVSYASQILEK